MARDSKLREIELKRQVNTEMQQQAADRLLREWEQNGPQEFNDLEDKYGDISARQYGKVMDQFMGPPDHDITVEEIRERYGSVTDYLQQRKRDNIDLNTREMSEREFALWKEGYSEGFKDGLQNSG